MGRPLQCPQCGASEANLLQDNIYQCKFCGTIYEYGDKDQQSVPHASESPVFDTKTIQEVPKKTAGCVAFGLFFVIAGIGAAVFFGTRNTKQSTTESKTLYKNYNESNSSFTAVNTVSGQQVWTVSRRNSDGLKEVSYFLNQVDPVANKVIKTVQLGNTITWDQSFKDGYKISQLKSIGNICFIAFGDSLMGYDVNTFEQVINNKTLGEKYPELKSGIAQIEDVYNLDGFQLTTSDGYKYYYVPAHDKLITQDEYDNGSKIDLETTVVTEYGFTGGERQQLFVLSRNIGKIFTNRISPTTLDDIVKEKDGWYKKTYKINSVKELTPDEIYFKGNVLYSDADHVVIAYQSQMGDNAPVTVKCLSADARVLWTKSGRETEIFKPMLNAGNTESFMQGDKLTVIQPYQEAVCLNLKDGSLDWSFKPY